MQVLITGAAGQLGTELASVFGGREAEILIFGPDNVTNGATSDIQQATRMARAMIMEWGMSDKLGRVRYRSNEQEVFLGHSVAQTNNNSHLNASAVNLAQAKMEELRAMKSAAFTASPLSPDAKLKPLPAKV